MSVDLIGSMGVTLMLSAFIINIFDKDRLPTDSIIYILLNLIGSILACYASACLDYAPFVVLELTWAMASAFALYFYFKKKCTDK